MTDLIVCPGEWSQGPSLRPNTESCPEPPSGRPIEIETEARSGEEGLRSQFEMSPVGGRLGVRFKHQEVLRNPEMQFVHERLFPGWLVDESCVFFVLV